MLESNMLEIKRQQRRVERAITLTIVLLCNMRASEEWTVGNRSVGIPVVGKTCGKCFPPSVSHRGNTSVGITTW